jgi:hypothetical protein
MTTRATAHLRGIQGVPGELAGDRPLTRCRRSHQSHLTMVQGVGQVALLWKQWLRTRRRLFPQGAAHRQHYGTVSPRARQRCANQHPYHCSEWAAAGQRYHRQPPAMSRCLARPGGLSLLALPQTQSLTRCRQRCGRHGAVAARWRQSRCHLSAHPMLCRCCRGHRHCRLSCSVRRLQRQGRPCVFRL